jgi:hypothetical protein
MDNWDQAMFRARLADCEAQHELEQQAATLYVSTWLQSYTYALAWFCAAESERTAVLMDKHVQAEIVAITQRVVLAIE